MASCRIAQTEWLKQFYDGNGQERAVRDGCREALRSRADFALFVEAVTYSTQGTDRERLSRCILNLATQPIHLGIQPALVVVDEIFAQRIDNASARYAFATTHQCQQDDMILLCLLYTSDAADE